MESSPKVANMPASFMRRMLRNQFLLLTVAMAIGMAAYVGIVLFRLLGH